VRSRAVTTQLNTRAEAAKQARRNPTASLPKSQPYARHPHSRDPTTGTGSPRRASIAHAHPIHGDKAQQQISRKTKRERGERTWNRMRWERTAARRRRGAAGRGRGSSAARGLVGGCGCDDAVACASWRLQSPVSALQSRIAAVCPLLALNNFPRNGGTLGLPARGWSCAAVIGELELRASRKIRPTMYRAAWHRLVP
jgi:hypothetical protein